MTDPTPESPTPDCTGCPTTDCQPPATEVPAAPTTRQEHLAVLGLANHAEWLIERFGPQLGDLLLDLLLQKSRAGVLPSLGGIFDVKSLLVMMLEKYGPEVLAKAQALASEKSEWLTKTVAEFKMAVSTRGEIWAQVATAALHNIPDDLIAKLVVAVVNRGSDVLLSKALEWLKSEGPDKFLPV